MIVRFFFFIKKKTLNQVINQLKLRAAILNFQLKLLLLLLLCYFNFFIYIYSYKIIVYLLNIIEKLSYF